MGGLAISFVAQHTSARPRSAVYGDFKTRKIRLQQPIFASTRANASAMKP